MIEPEPTAMIHLHNFITAKNYKIHGQEGKRQIDNSVGGYMGASHITVAMDHKQPPSLSIPV